MAFYTYLLSSLPMLQAGMKPPFSFEKFLAISEEQIPERDLEILNKIPLGLAAGAQTGNAVMDKWRAFEISLRNELVRLRAHRKKLDPSPYLREGGPWDAFCARTVSAVHRHPNILEAEEMLDDARWAFLDELGVGHYFDLDALIVYGIKLTLLERWDRIRSADGAVVLEEKVRTLNSEDAAVAVSREE